MIADIFRILGALYWVPAYQRGYYARGMVLVIPRRP